MPGASIFVGVFHQCSTALFSGVLRSSAVNKQYRLIIAVVVSGPSTRSENASHVSIGVVNDGDNGYVVFGVVVCPVCCLIAGRTHRLDYW